MEVPYKTKNRTTLWSSEPTVGCMLRENHDSKRRMHANVHSSTVHSSQDVEQPKCPWAGEWVKKMWSVCTVEYYLAIERKENRSFIPCFIDEKVEAPRGWVAWGCPAGKLWSQDSQPDRSDLRSHVQNRFETVSVVFFLSNSFYWRMLGLSVCANFSCTAKWISSTYTDSCLDFLPLCKSLQSTE